MSKRSLLFVSNAWEDYQYWQHTDKKVIQKINRLLAECLRTPFSGIGKPEPLRGNFAGLWSRRISGEHRLVYQADDAEVRIIACRYHY